MRDVLAALAGLAGLAALAGTPPGPSPEHAGTEARVEAREPPLAIPGSIRRALVPETTCFVANGRVRLRFWPARKIAIVDRGSDVGPPDARIAYKIAPGVPVGAVELTRDWTDAKGQSISPGVYLLVYAIQPLLKDHADTSEIRDFLLLVRPRDSAELQDADRLIGASRRVSRTRHPAVLALAAPATAGSGSEQLPRVEGAGEDRRVLRVSAGGLVLGLTVAVSGEPNSIPDSRQRDLRFQTHP